MLPPTSAFRRMTPLGALLTCSLPSSRSWGDVDAAHAMLLGPMLSCLLFVLGSHCVYDDWEQKKLAFGSMVPHACASLDCCALCPCPTGFPRCLAELSDQGGAANDRARCCDVRWRAVLRRDVLALGGCGMPLWYLRTSAALRLRFSARRFSRRLS